MVGSCCNLILQMEDVIFTVLSVSPEKDQASIMFAAA